MRDSHPARQPSAAQPRADLKELASSARSRLEFWTALLNREKPRTVAEIGVWRGNFAEHMLSACPSIERYFLVDPWRNLESWNKPLNVADSEFEAVLEQVRSRLAPFEAKCVYLRGKTTEVADELPGELDFAYIDGDHTLRGITIDLVNVFAKVRVGGIIGGDDLAPSVWQHGPQFEPTLVFPFAAFFAEAVGAPFYALPHGQFLIERTPVRSYEFHDLVGAYRDTALNRQFSLKRVLRANVRKWLGKARGKTDLK